MQPFLLLFFNTGAELIQRREFSLRSATEAGADAVINVKMTSCGDHLFLIEDQAAHVAITFFGQAVLGAGFGIAVSINGGVILWLDLLLRFEARIAHIGHYSVLGAGSRGADDVTLMGASLFALLVLLLPLSRFVELFLKFLLTFLSRFYYIFNKSYQNFKTCINFGFPSKIIQNGTRGLTE